VIALLDEADLHVCIARGFYVLGASSSMQAS